MTRKLEQHGFLAFESDIFCTIGLVNTSNTIFWSCTVLFKDSHTKYTKWLGLLPALPPYVSVSLPMTTTEACHVLFGLHVSDLAIFPAR